MTKSLGDSCGLVADPKFVTYLLNPGLVLDTYFLLGTEKIGAVKYMLCAHSEVLRSELEEGMAKENEVIVLNDVDPSTFRNFLKYVYGYNTIANHSFDEANNLLYVSEKYLMTDLTNELASRLMALLDAENICRLLSNPACHTVMELNAPITEIIQLDTNAVFASQAFLDIALEGFIKILEQDILNVPEIKVWRAALKWAKNKVGCEDGELLREPLRQSNNIRIRTIDFEDFCKEIVPSRVLPDCEVVEFCISHGKGEIPPAIEGFTDKTEKRFYFEEKIILYEEITNWNVCEDTSIYKYELCTSNFELILLSFEFSSVVEGPQDLTVQIIDKDLLTLDTPIIIYYDRYHDEGIDFGVPLKYKGSYIKLLPKTTYTVKLKIKVPHCICYLFESVWSSVDLTMTGLDGNKNVHCINGIRYINCSTSKKQWPDRWFDDAQLNHSVSNLDNYCD